MSPTEALILALVDFAAFALVGYSWFWPWFRARREKVPLPFLTVFALWAEGAPTHELIDAFVQLRRAGTPTTVHELRKAWWRGRDKLHGASEIAAAARYQTFR